MFVPPERGGRWRLAANLLAATLLLAGLSSWTSAAQAAETRPRVLYVDSYDPGFEWVQGLMEGLLGAFDIARNAEGGLDQSRSPVELRVFHMDSKRNPSDPAIAAAVARAREIIETWQPDLVIASDDNAARYLIAPHYNHRDLPFVFCGVNWDASAYGFPSGNVTGMTEVILIPELVEILDRSAAGRRIGLLAGDNFSVRKDTAYIERIFGLEIEDVYVSSFEDWKAAYLRLQREVDMLFVGVVPAVAGWDRAAAVAFVERTARIPSGSWDDWMAPLALASVTKRPQEQGEWAARTALAILDGTPPSAIPVVSNKQGRVLLNMRLARILGITFPIDLVERADFVQP